MKVRANKIRLVFDEDNCPELTLTLFRENVQEVRKGASQLKSRLESGVVNGKEFEHLRVCFGSSSYDTKQMARLLEGITNECRDLGIETRTPDELAEIMSLTEGNNE